MYVLLLCTVCICLDIEKKQKKTKPEQTNNKEAATKKPATKINYFQKTL